MEDTRREVLGFGKLGLLSFNRKEVGKVELSLI
jgi:hypothetical protein